VKLNLGLRHVIFGQKQPQGGVHSVEPRIGMSAKLMDGEDETRTGILRNYCIVPIVARSLNGTPL
jgi:hypothetical protein